MLTDGLVESNLRLLGLGVGVLVLAGWLVGQEVEGLKYEEKRYYAEMTLAWKALHSSSNLNFRVL